MMLVRNYVIDRTVGYAIETARRTGLGITAQSLTRVRTRFGALKNRIDGTNFETSTFQWVVSAARVDCIEETGNTIRGLEDRIATATHAKKVVVVSVENGKIQMTEAREGRSGTVKDILLNTLFGGIVLSLINAGTCAAYAWKEHEGIPGNVLETAAITFGLVSIFGVNRLINAKELAEKMIMKLERTRNEIIAVLDDIERRLV